MAVVEAVDHTVSDKESTLSPEAGPRGFVAVNHASSNGKILWIPQTSPYANLP